MTAGLLSLMAGASSSPGVNISDAAAEEAIRAELSKPTGEITEADLARVKVLDFSDGHLLKLVLPRGLVNLEEIDLSRNELAPSLFNPVTLPDDLNSLKILNLSGNRLTNLRVIEHLTTLEVLNVSSNDFSVLEIPGGLTNLRELDLSFNDLAPSIFNPVTFPDDLNSLKILNLSGNRLSNFGLIEHLITLEVLNVSDNGLEELEIPDSLTNLRELDLSFNALESFVLQEGFVNLEVLNLRRNVLVGSLFTGPVSFPNDLVKLRILNLSFNRLGTFKLPAGLLSLEELLLQENELGSLTFGGPLPSAVNIIAYNNKLRKVTLPEGLGNLDTLDLFGNQITELSIQHGMNTEPFIDLADNPIQRFTVPEGTHEDLINYFKRFDAEIIFVPRPLPNLVDTKILPTGEFEMVVAGPTGTYAVFASTDLIQWGQVGEVVNDLGEVPFTSPVAASPQTFLRIQRVPEEPEEE